MLVLCGGPACQSGENTVGVVLETALGEIVVRVDPDRAPISANNFLAWVEGGHYEGATFGRVVRGMEILEEIQGLPTLTEAGSEVTRGQMLEQPVVIRQARVLDD
ncbi:MAG: peptidylprolyl isomerase [Acidobacteria bacterium]|nr:peptidylprolyl isomerase [Acidobacteriota bacterium]